MTDDQSWTEREEDMSNENTSNDSDLLERIHALEVAQATQAATTAGAQATQAATQAGTMATNAAGMAGLAWANAAGAAGLIIGMFLGLAIGNSRG